MQSLLALSSLLLCLGTSAHARNEHYTSIGRIIGLNVGGWLLVEPYMTPSLFLPYFDSDKKTAMVQDEYTLSKTLGPEKALEVLKKHWDTWITEKDIAKYAAAGINTLRIGFGYWALLPDGPYVTGQVEYINKAIAWAAKYNLKMILDVHGAPLSQNGFDNSGTKGEAHWGEGDSIERTLEVLKKIVELWGDCPTVIAVEPVNEPASWLVKMETILDFHHKAYEILAPTGKKVILSDAFRKPEETYSSFPRDKYPSAIIDYHYYTVFENGLLFLNPEQRRNYTCFRGKELQTAQHLGLPMMVGEFSAAATDCATWLNGVGVGARYDGTYPGSQRVGDCAKKNSIKDMTSEEKNNVKNYLAAQIDAFDPLVGWIFWAAKTEDSDLWSFEALYDNGLFPINQKPGFCTSYINKSKGKPGHHGKRFISVHK